MKVNIQNKIWQFFSNLKLTLEWQKSDDRKNIYIAMIICGSRNSVMKIQIKINKDCGWSKVLVIQISVKIGDFDF